MTQTLTLPTGHDVEAERPTAPPRRSGKTLKLAIGAIVLAGLAVAGTRYLRWAEQFESTDDAYLDGKLHAVSSRVSGSVVEVLTDDNRVVKAGEGLLKLDRRDFEVHLEEAKSDLLSAEATIAQAEAQVAQAHGSLDQAGAFLAQTRAQQDKAAIDIRRAQQLLQHDVTPQSDFDTANANNEIAVAGSASARSSRSAAAATLRAAEATLRVAHAKRATAAATVRDAELQLSYTTVVAPADGRVGKKAVEVGQRVQPGQSLLAVVDDDVWIVANFKESQLTRMKVGQTVAITVDAIAGHELSGTVDSFSPGTGAKFSLLPPDNATGNFTKVVQRVPVKIRFARDSVHGYEDRLFPGLSVVATVKVKP